MNERWNELIKQAINEIGPEDNPSKEKTLKRYSELIIKECIERIKPEKMVHEIEDDLDMRSLPDYVIAATRTECIAEIKQHFGVK